MNVLRGQNRLVLGGSLHWIFQHPLMLISEESGLHTKKWQNVNVNATAEYRVPFVKGLKLKVQYNRTLDNRLIKKVNFPYEMYNFQTAGTNNKKNRKRGKTI